jgi:hypothetical protein
MRFLRKSILDLDLLFRPKGPGIQSAKKPNVNSERINRLLMVVFLAYYWIVALGVSAVKDGWQGVIHRRHRCD